MTKRPKSSSAATVTFWGAARTVTGSMHQVEACGQSLLLDCGLYQGRRAEDHTRNHQFPFRPRDLDAVLLSHAHIDHCGNLPNLVKQGFAGPIYCTPATRALTAVLLGDAAKIYEEDANHLHSRRRRDEPALEPLYDGRDVYRTLLRLQAVPYDTPFPIGPDLEAEFVDAGHLLGSAMIRLRGAGRSGTWSLTYTGDLGRAGLPVLRAPAPVPPAPLLICESTYGGRQHGAIEETAAQLGDVVLRTAERGGKLIIPAFSVGRTQTILYFLHQLRSAGRLPDLPVFVDSPLALRATEVFRAHPECFNEATLHLVRGPSGLFGEQHIYYLDKVHESIALNERREPCIIISAGGMCEAGRVLHHLKHHIEDCRCTILLTGWQAADTLGRRLLERCPEVRILGRSLALKAEVAVLNGLSSHPDHDGLVERLRPLVGTARQVRLVHGEPERAAALADGLRAAGFADVAIPDRSESIAIASTNC